MSKQKKVKAKTSKKITNKKELTADYKEVDTKPVSNSAYIIKMIERTKPEWIEKRSGVRRVATLGGTAFVTNKSGFIAPKKFELTGDPRMGLEKVAYFDIQPEMVVYGNIHDPTLNPDDTRTQLESGEVSIDQVVKRPIEKPLVEQVVETDKDDEIETNIVGS